MLIIPLQSVPNQALTVNLAGQNCQINVYVKPRGLFLDLRVNNELIVAGVICQYLNRIVRNAYLGFDGDLLFVDDHGTSDPDWQSFDDRFHLAYVTAAELPPEGNVD